MRHLRGVSEVFYPSNSGLRPLKSPTDEDLLRFNQEHKVNAFNCLLLVSDWTALLADCPATGYVPRKIAQKHFYELFNNVGECILRYSQLADILTNSVSHTDHGTSIRFIDEMRDTPVFREYLHFYRTGSSSSYQYIYSFLVFGKKLYYENEDLKTDALRTWLEIEDRLGSLQLPSWIDDLKTVIDFALEHYNHIPLPVHGGGSVAQDTRDPLEKHLLVESAMSMRVLFAFNGKSGVDYRSRLSPSGYDWRVNLFATYVAKLMFVPKTFFSLRSICKEPAECQWAQQSVRLALEVAIKRGFLSQSVFINDQTENRKASLFGSMSSLVDTLDLSAASDSVAWDLVKSVFPRRILMDLAATRSTHTVLPTGETHKLVKFAPMGSAVCFPVQTVLFAAIITVAAHKQRNGDRAIRRRDILRLFSKSFHFGDDRRYQPFRVYGDDLICDSQITSKVVELLTSLGFSVNTKKSFTGDSAFRESCGIHCLDGKDVTPLYFRFGRETDHRLSGKRATSLTELCNRAREYKYYRTARHLQEIILHQPMVGVRQRNGFNPIPFSDKEDGLYLFSPKPVNDHLIHRRYGEFLSRDDRKFIRSIDRESKLPNTSKRYQRDEILRISVIADKVDVVDFDNYYYIQWMRSRLAGGGNDDVKPSPSASKSVRTHIEWVWTPF